MSRKYLAWRVRILSGPIVAFREYFFREVLPPFGNIDVRADTLRNECFNNIGRQLARDDGIDMADAADAAQEHALDWWEMMTSLRQSMLNLAAAGLFHLVEQQLTTLSADGLFRGDKLPDTKLSNVSQWYRDELDIDLTALPSWKRIGEMRKVANTIKHGEGSSAKQLRALRPELFVNPAYNRIYEREGLSMAERMREQKLAAPLSGEDFFVTEEVLLEYATSAEAFFNEIAAAFEQQG
ncbi:MAG: hypothetical protein ACKV2U_18895 [Bryobacteraceae bacterium]